MKRSEEKKTFIAGVINARYESKSKTESIRIIAKAAEHHMRELKWKEINEELRIQSSQKEDMRGLLIFQQMHVS